MNKPLYLDDLPPDWEILSRSISPHITAGDVVKYCTPTDEGLELLQSQRYWHDDGQPNFAKRMVQKLRAEKSALPLNTGLYDA